MTGWEAVIFLCYTIFSVNTGGRVVLGVITGCSTLCCVGLLRRRRFGVVLFVATYLILLIAVPLLDAFNNKPTSNEKQGQSFLVLVFTIMTTIYFKRRWRLMDS